MKRFGQYLILFVLVGLIVVGVTQAQYIRDTVRLHGYQPSAAVQKLATDTTMTDKSRRIFYVNKPDIAERTDFRTHCGSNREQTIVLGCYHGNQNGIYLLDVTDQRLAGVEQVTAAHEMLHAAYDRLSSKQKADINRQLEAYYATVTDERIKKTIDAYRISEPNDVVNEMHSIFPTEIADLPESLEQYYQQYFTNRKAITDVAAAYENEFSSRRQQVDAADASLGSLKQQIDTRQTALANKSEDIQSDRSQLNEFRSSGNNAAYNAAVPAYNAKVDSYNNDLATLRRLINQYNQQVQERNAIAEQIDTLVDAISSNDVPSEQQ